MLSARDNAVKSTNDLFRHVQDDGGQCPRDTVGLAALLEEMSAAMPDEFISVASQAAGDYWTNQCVSAEQAKYIDQYYIVNYDYTVSDLPDEQPISPNQNLCNAPLLVVQWSINYTLHCYLAAGVSSAAV